LAFAIVLELEESRREGVFVPRVFAPLSTDGNGAEALGPESTNIMRANSTTASSISPAAAITLLRFSAPTFNYAPLFR